MPDTTDRAKPDTRSLRIPADLGRLWEVRDLVRTAADEASAT